MGSEMCIRDRNDFIFKKVLRVGIEPTLSKELDFESSASTNSCLLYTSDAADDMQCVDLGGRRIIKKQFLKV